MDKTRYIFAVLLVATIPPGVIWWYLVHPFVAFWRRLGPRWTLWIVGVLMVSLMLALGALRHRLMGADLGTNWFLVALGVAFAVIAVLIGLKRKRYLTTPILSEGPYAIIRHPRYVEVMAGVLGYALAANFVGGYAVAALTVPALHLVVVLEERELGQRFGSAYEAYCATVPRYIPRWTLT